MISVSKKQNRHKARPVERKMPWDRIEYDARKIWGVTKWIWIILLIVLVFLAVFLWGIECVTYQAVVRQAEAEANALHSSICSSVRIRELLQNDDPTTEVLTAIQVLEQNEQRLVGICEELAKFRKAELQGSTGYCSELWRSIEITGMAFLTIGFGDQTPRNGLGKVLALVDGMIGLVVFGFLAGLTVYLTTKWLRLSLAPEKPPTETEDENSNRESVHPQGKAPK